MKDKIGPGNNPQWGLTWIRWIREIPFNGLDPSSKNFAF